METKTRRIVLACTLAAIVGAIVMIEQPWSDQGCSTLEPTGSSEGRAAPDLCGAEQWIQGETTLQSLQGEVVLVDFWTYSCVNCIRTLPHLTAWQEAYAPHGFTIIGVHTPEFAFEKNPNNVREAIDRHDITYPVVQDNDYTIWDNYNNRFWPAKYLIGPEGRIVYTHFGEGAYAETEQLIRDLLIANGATNLPAPVEEGVSHASGGGFQTRELYLGYGRQSDTLGNPEGYRPEESVQYTIPEEGRPDVAYLGGSWFNGEESLTAEGNSQLLLSFAAGGANFVADGSGCIEVIFDGAPMTAQHAGQDVRLAGDVACVDVAGARSYDFYAGSLERHTVLLSVPAGVELYTFAFSQNPTVSA